MSHLVLQLGANIDCPLAENLEDIVRDVYVYRSMTQKSNSDLTLGNYEWEPRHGIYVYYQQDAYHSSAHFCCCCFNNSTNV